MKKILTSSITCLLLFHVSHSQCLSKGITTNPAAPVNTELPSNKNLYFDWTQQYFSNNSTCQSLTQVESPFYKIDNLEALRVSKDMLPVDGWELIRRDLGYTDANALKPEVPQHTYFILYNKFTGILRILLKTCRGVDYNGAKISLKFDATSNFQTALLSLTDSTIKDLGVTHSANPVAQSVSTYVNDDTKWFYADFPMAYDPCTCQYASKLNIISNLIQNSTITLQGSAAGSITTITNGAGTVSNDGKFSFKDFVTNTSEKFQKTYTNVDNMITQTKTISDALFGANSTQSTSLTSFQTALKSSSFLKAGLAAVPWIKSAVSLFDLFTAGGKASTQPVQIMPLAVNLAIKLNGSISTSNQYHNIIFATPGSLNAQNDPSTYPFYNEILGVFNLLNTPTFIDEFANGTFPNVSATHMLRLKEPIKWVINPASGLDVQDAQLAFTAITQDPTQGLNSTTLPDNYSTNGLTILEGKDATTNKYVWRTDYMNISCLANNFDFKFAWSGIKMGVPKFYLKLILNLKKLNDPNGQNILQVITFPVKLEGKYATSQTSFAHTMFNPTSCVGGYFIKANSLDKNLFCVSTAYQTNRFLRVAQDPIFPIPSETDDKAFAVSPNPASDYLTVSVGKNEVLHSISLISSTGQILKSKKISDNSNTQKLDVRGYSSGLYVLKVITSKTIHTKKIILSRL